MRVAVVGGAGAMGGAVVRATAGLEEVTDLLVLDRDVRRAEELVGRVGPKAKAVLFDAERDDLPVLLAGSAVVVSALGPFTVFGRTVLEAAIEAGCDYVDINDDWEPTLDVLTLGSRAREAGTTALVGMGASPGVSNVLAAKAAAELDDVHELVTGWAVAGTGSQPGGARPSAAMLHLVHEASGLVQVVENGAHCMQAPLQPVTLDYPGLGEVEVRTIGHPEAVTLPRVFPGLRRCVNVMAGPGWWFDHLVGVMRRVDADELAARDAALILEEPVTRPEGAPRGLRTPTVWAWARGLSGGRLHRVGVGMNRWPHGRMAGATAIPAAVALQMVLRGEIAQHGVVTAEEVVPFELLMERLAPSYVLPDPANELCSIVVEKD